MASQKLSALVSLAGGQVPTDLIYVDDLSAGAAGSKSSTFNDAFSIITRNITDGAVRFGGFAAPTPAASQGSIYYDSATNRFKFSENNGAYRNLGDVSGPTSATDNAITRFDGTTGKIIQNSLVTVDDAGVFSGAIIGAGNTLGPVTMTLGSDATGDIYYRAAGGALTRLGIGSATQILTVSAGLPSWQPAPSSTQGGANTQVQYNNSGAFGGISGFTSDGTNVTAGSGNLRATLPQITTGIRDANANLIIGLTPVGSSVNQFTIADAATGGSPTLSTTGGDGDIVFTISPKGTARLESTGPLRLSGTGTDTYTTPQANSVPTKINVPNFDPGNFGQILAMGIANLATNRRVLSLFDGRTVAHQPTLAVFSPDENNLIGFSWDGSNTIGFVKNTTGIVGLQDQVIQQSAGVNLVTLDTSANAYFGNGIVNAAPASYVLQATGGSGSDIAGANLDLAGGKGTGLGVPGMVGIRYPLIGASGSTLQSLSTNRFPVQTDFYLNYSTTTTVTNTTTETSLLGAADAGTQTIEAGLGQVDRIFNLAFRGTLAGLAAATLNIRLKLGGTTIQTWTGTVTSLAVAWVLDVLATVTIAGAGGAIKVSPSAFIFGTGSLTIGSATTSINFAVNEQWTLTAQWGTASPSNILSYEFGNISIAR